MSPVDMIGWDIGGAHVKACLLRDGRVADAAEWPCPLWQGLEHLEHALQQARARWPALDGAAHAVTMTGEMTDLFEHREDGVRRIAVQFAAALAPGSVLRLFAGPQQWRGLDEIGAHWREIASANWRATALHAAQSAPEGVLIDIGSTTTDLIAFRAGRVLGTSTTDADRLASGELVYHGVVRTPLCALGPRVAWRGEMLNVMNEFFATSADVYRLTDELDPAHDLHPSADAAAKDAPASRRRLARMIGLDARDAREDEWLAFALGWRERQVDEIAVSLRRVIEAHRLSAQAVAISAGCGAFLAADVIARAGAAFVCRRYGSAVARVAAGASLRPDALIAWAQVCAPAVAVAALYDGDHR
ncbi:MAG TPA: hydantoinase/oxoprolinase family protein [Burkholderiaceae bacterium]|nr:hydantoinase/oxoprolinase family protein [Burkholderiaceae bacterium]